MSDTNLAQIPNALFENAITNVGTGLTKSGNTIVLNKATSSTIGGILPPDGYYIDSTTGQLKGNQYKLIETIWTGYSITTEQPTEGWLTSSDTVVDQDLTIEGFTPTTGTFYRHTGSTINYLYQQNGIYYYNGIKLISYYTNTGTGISPVYTVIKQPTLWVEGNIYKYDDMYAMFTEPSDWSTNWKNYWNGKIGFILNTQTTAPEFIPNKYYNADNSAITITRNNYIDGTSYKLSNLFIVLNHRAYTTNVSSYTCFLPNNASGINFNSKNLFNNYSSNLPGLMVGYGSFYYYIKVDLISGQTFHSVYHLSHYQASGCSLYAIANMPSMNKSSLTGFTLQSIAPHAIITIYGVEQ